MTISKYDFYLGISQTEGGLQEKSYKVGDHKVHSGVFTTLYYKVMENPNYKLKDRYSTEYNSDYYYDKRIYTTFVHNPIELKDLK